MKFFLNFLILATIVACIKAQDFSYADQSAWYDETNWQCNGNLQSPIELDRNNAIRAPGRLQFIDYDKPFTSPPSLRNNGHSVEIQIPPNTAYFTGYWFSDRFKLHSCHLHWGSSQSFGSEHVVDGKRHSAELHIVHYNSKYPNQTEAANYEDGLAVLAIFLQVDPDQETSWPALKPIVDALPLISNVGTSVKLNNFFISKLLRDVNFRTFFNYVGSLTTPPCHQSVNWFVCPNAVPVTSDELAAFGCLLDSNGNTLHNNYRCLQPRNNRNVFLFSS